MAKVFAAHETSLQLGRAEEWGELMFVHREQLTDLSASDLNSKKIEDGHLLMRKHFNPLTDYLLPVGHPAMIGFLFSVAVDMAREFMAEPKINYLQWDSLRKDYKLITVNVPELRKERNNATIQITHQGTDDASGLRASAGTGGQTR